MKRYKFLMAATVSGLVLGQAAQASTLAASAGDLILSFRVTDSTDLSGGASGNGTKNLEIDLGNANSFLNTNFTLSLGADLTALFGTSWNSASTLVWSAASSSGGTSSNVLWATSPANANIFARQSGSLQNSTRATIDLVRSGLDGQTSTGFGLNAAIVDATAATSYTSKVTLGSTTYYGYTKFSGGIENGVASSGNVSSDLYYLPSGSGAGTDWGTFNLSSDGTLTYTAAAAVPEPSTYAAVLMGGGLLLLTRRTRLRWTAGS